MRAGFAEIENSNRKLQDAGLRAKFELRNRANFDRARSKTKSTSTKESATIEDDCVDLGLLLRLEEKWEGCRKTLMIMTQALREFFLSEDIANFTIKNDDS
jgi:hypothetical protein